MPVTLYAKKPDTRRFPSDSIWAFFDETNLVLPGRSIHIFQEFSEFPVVAAGAQAGIGGGWKGFASTGGGGTVVDEVGGVYDLASDGDDEGASIGTIHYPFQIARGKGKLLFEVRLKTTTIDNTKHGIFVGLIDSSTLSATVPIAAAGTLADENFVGFHRLEADGDMFDTVYKADAVTQVTVKADAVEIAADTYVKLGMVYDPETYLLTFYKNGQPLPDKKLIPVAAGTDFPNDVRLGLVAAVLNATGTTPGSTRLDWVRCAQILDR